MAGTLIQASDGNLYGTTTAGGRYGSGSVFQVTLQGAFQTLYEFSGPDGVSPADLVEANNGLLYATTASGGQYGHGTFFQIQLGGSPPPTPANWVPIRNAHTDTGSFCFNWDSISGRCYRVEYSTNLSMTNWYNWNASLWATNSTTGIAQRVSDSPRFYRVLLLP